MSFLILKPTNINLAVYGNGLGVGNDVMNHVDCVIKRDVYQQKMLSCSKNIRGLSVFFFLKIFVVYQKTYIMGDIAWIFA